MFSAKQYVYFAGEPWVERSIAGGRAPPTLSSTSDSARPIIAFARTPCPKQLPDALSPSRSRAGPLTTTSGAHGWVVASEPWRL